MPKKSVKRERAEHKEPARTTQSSEEVVSTVAIVSPNGDNPAQQKKVVGILKLNKSIIFYGVGLIVLLGIAAVPGYYFYNKSEKAQSQLAGSLPQGEREVKELLEEVGAIYQLPSGESPTIATVSDVSKLAKQPFFAQAQNGDKVLVFGKSQKAILYRQSSGKIIEIAPITLPSSPSAQVAGEATGSAKVTGMPVVTEAPVSVVILNGTKTAGLAKKAETELATDKMITILSRGNATSDHEETLIVDLTEGKKAKQAEKIAQALGGSVADLPEEESAPANAEILIILGSDYVK